eukprot:403339691
MKKSLSLLFSLGVSLTLVNIGNIQSKEVNLKFKSTYCVKDPIYYALEAQYFQNPVTFWSQALTFNSNTYLQDHPMAKHYDNPDDQHRLEYYNQLELQESTLFETQLCPLWIKVLSKHSNNGDKINFRTVNSQGGHSSTNIHQDINQDAQLDQNSYFVKDIFCGIDKYLSNQKQDTTKLNQGTLPSSLNDDEDTQHLPLAAQYFSHFDTLDPQNDKYLIQNLNDPEVLVVYLDFTDKSLDISHVFSKLENKNIVLRYKFMGDCMKQGQDTTTELLRGVGIDLKVQNPQSKMRNGDDLFLDTFLFKKRSHKFRAHEIYDPYQTHIFNEVNKANNLSDVALILQNHPNFIIHENKTDKAENIFNFTGKVTKEEFIIMNYKCVRLGLHTSDPVHLNKQIQEVFKNTMIINKYVDDPTQLYQNILTYHFQGKPVFMPSELFSDQNVIFSEILQNLNIESTPTAKSIASTLNYKHKRSIDITALKNIVIPKQLENFTQPTIAIQIVADILDAQNYEKTLKLCQTIAQISNNQNLYTEVSVVFSIQDQHISEFNDDSVKEERQKQLSNNIDKIVKEIKSGKEIRLNKVQIKAASDICSEYNICEHQLFMVINQRVIDPLQLNQLFKSQSSEKLLQNSLSNLILQTYQDLPQNYSTYLTKNDFNLYKVNLQILQDQYPQSQLSTRYQFNILNQLKLRENEQSKLPTLRFIDDLKNVKSEHYIHLTVLTSNPEELQNFMSLYDSLPQDLRDQVFLDTQPDTEKYMVSGHITLISALNLFINGNQVQHQGLSKSFLVSLIEAELAKISYLLKNVNFRGHNKLLKLINELSLMDLASIDNQTDNYDCSREYERAATLSKSKKKFKTSQSYLLKMKAKFNTLSRNSLNAISLLSQQKLGASIEVSFFTPRSLGIQLRYLDSHYFKLFWNEYSIRPEAYNIKPHFHPRFSQMYIDIAQSRRQLFTLDVLDNFNSQFQLDQSIKDQAVFGVSGYTLQMDLKKLALQNKVNSDGFIKVEFKQSKMNQLLRLDQTSKSDSLAKESFMIINERGQIVNYAKTILDQYIQLVLPGPGKYLMINEKTLSIEIINYNSVVYQSNEIPVIHFDQRLNLENPQLDYTTQYSKTQPMPYQNTIQLRLLSTKTTLSKDYINLFYTVSGGLYEAMALHQIYQLLQFFPQQNFKLFIYEGIYCSPDFKIRLRNLLTYHTNFAIKFINYPWPEQLVHLDFSPKRQINLYRIMFLDNIFPPDVDRVIYRDADQCNVNHSDLSELASYNMKGYPQGQVKHCSFFGGKGYDPNQIMRQLKKNFVYYTNNIILLDIKVFRDTTYSDAMINYYQFRVRENGFDPFLLSQDLQSPAQDVVPIYPLPEEWSWAEDFCDPTKREKAKLIDFQDMKRENKLQIAKRVCPGFENGFVEMINKVQKPNITITQE